MKITEIKYMFRRNLGNYEHEELTLVAHIDKGDDVQDSIDTLKEDVVKNLGDYMENENGKKKNSKKKASRKASKKDEEEQEEDEEDSEEDESVEEDEDEDSEEDSDDEDEDDSEDDDEEDEEEEEKPKKGKSKAKGKAPKAKASSKKKTTTKGKGKGKKSPKPKPGKSGTKFRSLGTPYNPKNQLHSKLVGEIVEAKYKNWRKKESLIKRSIKASNKLKGAEFIDKAGDVIPEFSKAFLKHMKK